MFKKVFKLELFLLITTEKFWLGFVEVWKMYAATTASFDSIRTTLTIILN